MPKSRPPKWKKELQSPAAEDYWRLVMSRRKKHSGPPGPETWLNMMNDLLADKLPARVFTTAYFANRDGPSTGDDVLDQLLREAWSAVEMTAEMPEYEGRLRASVGDIIPRYQQRLDELTHDGGA